MGVPEEIREEVEALFHTKTDHHGEPVVESCMDENRLVYWGKKDLRPKLETRDGYKAVSWGTDNYVGVYYLPYVKRPAMTLDQALAKLREVKERMRVSCDDGFADHREVKRGLFFDCWGEYPR